jgi:hypothetical protein
MNLPRVPHFWPILPEVGIFGRANPRGLLALRTREFFGHPKEHK